MHFINVGNLNNFVTSLVSCLELKCKIVNIFKTPLLSRKLKKKSYNSNVQSIMNLKTPQFMHNNYLYSENIE